MTSKTFPGGAKGGRISAVAFDLFGTIGRWSDSTVPSAAHVLFHYAPDLDHLRAAEVIALIEGRDGEAQFDVPPDATAYQAWQEQSWSAAARTAGVVLDEDVRRLMHLAVQVRELELFPDAIPALRMLSERGIRWVLCSNASPDVAAKLDALLPRELRPAAAVLSCHVGARKPHPRMYRALSDVIVGTPSETLFIGDRADCDYYGPQLAGFAAALVHRPGTDRPVDAAAAPETVPHEHRWDSLSRLREVLRDPSFGPTQKTRTA
jgi:putative hydrolase of the HAD superfamily